MQKLENAMGIQWDSFPCCLLRANKHMAKFGGNGRSTLQRWDSERHFEPKAYERLSKVVTLLSILTINTIIILLIITVITTVITNNAIITISTISTEKISITTHVSKFPRLRCKMLAPGM